MENRLQDIYDCRTQGPEINETCSPHTVTVTILKNCFLCINASTANDQ